MISGQSNNTLSLSAKIKNPLPIHLVRVFYAAASRNGRFDFATLTIQSWLNSSHCITILIMRALLLLLSTNLMVTLNE